MALGGRAAEEIVYGLDHVTSGCSSDLESASSLARSMIRNLGYSSHGLLIRDGNYGSHEYFNRVDIEANTILTDSYDRVRTIIKDNLEAMHQIVKILLEKETLEVSEIKSIIET